MQVLILLVLCAGAGWLLWSHLQSVKAEDTPPIKRFAGETREYSDIDLSALSQIDFLKSFDDIKIKAEGPRGTTISIDSPL